MAATVTIDKSYFETLLRRYVQLTTLLSAAAKFFDRAEFVCHTHDDEW